MTYDDRPRRTVRVRVAEPEPARKTSSSKKASPAKASSARASTAKASSAKASRASTPRKAASTRATTTRGTSRSGSRSSGRSAALAKSAPTTRMSEAQLRHYDDEPRGPSAADVLAIAFVLFMSALAACSSQFERGKATTPNGDAGLAGDVVVRFLDVGQGDSILVQSPEGKTMLVDGGRSTERMRALLAQYGVQKVDLMVASHADADHIAGLVEAAKTTSPTLFINNGVAGTTQTWERLVTALQESGTTFQKANNQTINLGSVRVTLMAPPAGMGDDQNNNSVGVLVKYGSFKALMTGDSEKPETTGWMQEQRPEIQGPFQVYKSIHHGATNGDHAAWLGVVQPENVVISVGDNSYGHPTPSALDLYRDLNVRVYRTDQHGTITFKGKPDGTYVVDSER